MKKKIGDYILDSTIGSGAFGKVYCAKKPNSKELFAVKMISKINMSSKLRFYLDREIEILQLLDSPHVVKLIDLRATENNYYLVFEYCNGGDLAKYREVQGGKLNETVVRKMLKQIIDGLRSVYAAGGIHRDIKLANILLHYSAGEDAPTLKICDFGFARLVEASDVDGPLEMSIVGTPLNMSPELLNKKPYTVKSDVWSLGIIAYELLCGTHAFSGINRKSLTNAIEMGAYKVAKELNLSSEALDFLNSCFQYNYMDRPNWEELERHPFIGSEAVTPFAAEALRGAGFMAQEDGDDYVFNSKTRYDFLNIIVKTQDEPLNTLNERIIEEIVPDECEEFKQSPESQIKKELRKNKASADIEEKIEKVQMEELKQQTLKEQERIAIEALQRQKKLKESKQGAKEKELIKGSKADWMEELEKQKSKIRSKKVEEEKLKEMGEIKQSEKILKESEKMVVQAEETGLMVSNGISTSKESNFSKLDVNEQAEMEYDISNEYVLLCSLL
eukprot:TRINITY_DN4004_c0_g2_i5.p1 TRINITY_DN4004_c0_g2~~TRINITY_DN4004_c0_g2_i5.p1  ORF type:complete len:503 (+),score=148.74 TRINITY_DN4004_c0_g2_i5:176-1684(+)